MSSCKQVRPSFWPWLWDKAVVCLPGLGPSKPASIHTESLSPFAGGAGRQAGAEPQPFAACSPHHCGGWGRGHAVAAPFCAACLTLRPHLALADCAHTAPVADRCAPVSQHEAPSCLGTLIMQAASMGRPLACYAGPHKQAACTGLSILSRHSFICHWHTHPWKSLWMSSVHAAAVLCMPHAKKYFLAFARSQLLACSMQLPQLPYQQPKRTPLLRHTLHTLSALTHHTPIPPIPPHTPSINPDALHVAGIIHGGLPQLPLTALNSVVAVCQLSGDLFPGREARPAFVAASVGLMNLVGPWLGALPVCHGAGGLAAQVCPFCLPAMGVNVRSSEYTGHQCRPATCPAATCSISTHQKHWMSH